MNDRTVAGFFVGVTGVFLNIIGALPVMLGQPPSMELIAVGGPIVTGLLAFFVGETNGKRETINLSEESA
jgi:hypothetical protein